MIYQHYFHGAFELDDIELGEHSLMRLGNVIVPTILRRNYRGSSNACSRGHIQITAEETGLTGADAWIGFGSITWFGN